MCNRDSGCPRRGRRQARRKRKSYQRLYSLTSLEEGSKAKAVEASFFRKELDKFWIEPTVEMCNLGSGKAKSDIVLSPDLGSRVALASPGYLQVPVNAFCRKTSGGRLYANEIREQLRC